MNRELDQPIKNKEFGSPRTAVLPRGIWALGFVSMFADISSEMIHSLLPVFLVTVLGASTLAVGLIEGVGEATASISKLFSGWLSDRWGKRKLLTGLGYGLGALSKPLFALAPSTGWILAARFSDRIGKGIRGAPRDALVGELVSAEVRGAAYGLRQSLDTVGAFTGPLLAMVMMAWFADFRLVFWVAVIPGILSVAVLIFGVVEPSRAQIAADAPPILQKSDVGRLGGLFWSVVAVGAVLTLARFSEAFLILRAQETGLPIALAPLVLVVMNVVYALSAYPVGALSDRISRPALIVAGFIVLICADLILALIPSLWAVLLGSALWGLHLGMTQGLLAALVADTTPVPLRGTAFGVFYLASGVALFLASLIAGTLWNFVGPSATFLSGAAIALAGTAGVAALSVPTNRRLKRVS